MLFSEVLASATCLFKIQQEHRSPRDGYPPMVTSLFLCRCEQWRQSGICTFRSQERVLSMWCDVSESWFFFAPAIFDWSSCASATLSALRVCRPFHILAYPDLWVFIRYTPGVCRRTCRQLFWRMWRQETVDHQNIFRFGVILQLIINIITCCL